MTPQTIDKFAGAMIDILKKTIEPIKTELTALRREVGELKARPMQKWAGPYVTGTRYAEASLVTRGGSLWAAVKATTEAPGHSGDWRLIVKKGAYNTERDE